MANQSVLELAVGTGKWDAGLKKAQQSLNNFTQAQGGLQQALAKDNGDIAAASWLTLAGSDIPGICYK